MLAHYSTGTVGNELGPAMLLGVQPNHRFLLRQFTFHEIASSRNNYTRISIDNTSTLWNKLNITGKFWSVFQDVGIIF